MANLSVWNPQYRTYLISTTAEAGTLVKLATAENTVDVINNADDFCIGVISLKAEKANTEGEVYEFGGDAIALSGGPISKGTFLVANASGKLVESASANGTYHCIAIALETVAAADTLFRVRLDRFSVTKS